MDGTNSMLKLLSLDPQGELKKKQNKTLFQYFIFLYT